MLLAAATGCWAPQADARHKTKGPHASAGVLWETTTDSLHWLTDASWAPQGNAGASSPRLHTVSQSQRRSAPPAWLRRILCGGGETRVPHDPQGVSRSARACRVYISAHPNGPWRTATYAVSPASRRSHMAPYPPPARATTLGSLHSFSADLSPGGSHSCSPCHGAPFSARTGSGGHSHQGAVRSL